MATTSLKLYARGLNTFRSLTKKTVGSWQDTDGDISQRQPGLLDSRFFRSDSERRLSSSQTTDDLKIGETVQRCSNACSLQIAKFHSRLEQLEKGWRPKEPNRDEVEALKWPAKIYQRMNWAMRLEPVLRQMLEPSELEHRPTVLSLLFGTTEHSTMSRESTHHMKELACPGLDKLKTATVPGEHSQPTDSAPSLVSLVERLNVKFAEFRNEFGVMATVLQQSMDGVQKGVIARVAHKQLPEPYSTGSIAGAGRTAARMFSVRHTRPSLFRQSHGRYSRIQRVYFHSMALKPQSNGMDVSIHRWTLANNRWQDMISPESEISTPDGIESTEAKEVPSCFGVSDSTGDAEDYILFSDEVAEIESPKPQSLSPYKRMFGEICPQKMFRLPSYTEPSEVVNRGDDRGDVVSQHSEPGSPRGFTKEFSNNTIGGSARVHLGDLYYDHVTINQFYVLQDADVSDAEQIGRLRGLGGMSQLGMHPVQGREEVCLEP